jgi:hypothetical protein
VRVRRRPVLDEYVEQGESAVLLATHVVTLSPVATEICEFVGTRVVDVDAVAHHLVDVFGLPEDASPLATTTTMLEDLAASGVVELLPDLA